MIKLFKSVKLMFIWLFVFLAILILLIFILIWLNKYKLPEFFLCILISLLFANFTLAKVNNKTKTIENEILDYCDKQNIKVVDLRKFSFKESMNNANIRLGVILGPMGNPMNVERSYKYMLFDSENNQYIATYKYRIIQLKKIR